MTSDDLVKLLAELLTGATGAGNNVYAPRDWPVSYPETPYLLLQTPRETKTSRGNVGGPQFVTIATVRIEGKITSKAILDDQNAEQGAKVVQDALALLKRQVELALIGNAALMQNIQKIARVETITRVVSESARHVGEMLMDWDFEYPEDPEDFAPTVSKPLEQFATFADLINVFDTTGEYTPPMDYTPTDAPRTSGPDGRAEASIITDLPQE
jgi:hypothetical protein